MTDNVRLGRWVILAVIIIIALSELALASMNIIAGTFRSGQFGRVILTGWLLWQIWVGANWARWLSAGLFLVSGFGAIYAACSPSFVNGRLMVVVLLAGFGATCVLISVGLALPCVGAYQAARRKVPDTE
jgi:hypothetical protein